MLLLAIEALADKNNDTPSNAHLRGRELAVGVVSPTGTQQYRLNKGKAQWYKVQSNQHYYRYNFQQDCNTCANHNYPWRVKLQGGQPPVAVDTLGNRHSGALSIAGMFAKLQKDIVDPNIKSVDADYDEEIGYPARFTIEYDDGFVITSKVFNFQFEKDSAQDQLTEHKKTWESQHIRDYDFTYFEEGKLPVLFFACLCLSFEKTNSLSRRSTAATTKGDNPHGIAWPLLVKVRNGKPWETYDRNGNLVDNLIPQTLDQYFWTIQRQLNKQGVFVDNEYSKRGYATNIDIVTPDIGEIKFHFCTFNDVVAPT